MDETTATHKKDFEEGTQEDALRAASDWVGDFNQHGVMRVYKVEVNPVIFRSTRWVATVHYSET